MNKQIIDIIEWFRWDRIYVMMKAVGWRYATSEGDVKIGELITTAIRLLEQVEKEGDGVSISTGGFKATNKKSRLKLEFIVDSVRSKEYE